jgi:hypothetical protein
MKYSHIQFELPTYDVEYCPSLKTLFRV